MNTVDPQLYVLPDSQNRNIFQSNIIAEKLTDAVSVDTPVVVFVAAQPGAGKSSTSAMYKESFRNSGGITIVNSDDLKQYHPMYETLMAENDVDASTYTSIDSRKWRELSQDFLINNRCNILVEETGQNLEAFNNLVSHYHGNGYQVELAVMGVQEALSRMGILDRYVEQKQEKGSGRFVPTERHDLSFHNIERLVKTVEENRTVDIVSVWKRGNKNIFTNQLDESKRWVLPPMASQTLLKARADELEYGDALNCLETLDRLRTTLSSPEWKPQLNQVSKLLEPHVPVGAKAAHSARHSFPRLTHPLNRNNGESILKKMPSNNKRKTNQIESEV